MVWVRIFKKSYMFLEDRIHQYEVACALLPDGITLGI